MRTKNTPAYAILGNSIETHNASDAATIIPVLVLDKTGAAMSDTNRARLEAKLELLQSISDDFKDCKVTPISLKQIAV
jgi:hypothetical protein